MAQRKKLSRVFDTDKRIRLGIWGLGRGMSFYKTCQALNIDVVAGCDYNEHMRTNFLAHNPGAFATADADEFLKQDFDAVLLATFCPAHADDAIRCLNAGKHVLSEVTAFHTMEEGVRLVEAVERTGKVYNLAENYPFTPANMYLARKWKEGLFGDLMYAEYEYVHECRSLCYTYIDGMPVQPGWTVHSWRSWLNGHYYCTHSLGPVMVITGERPVRVQSLPGGPRLAGYISEKGGVGFVAPSLIRMSNGGLVRNLMGATTNDSHVQRLWGTLGAAEQGCAGGGLQLRLGASGGAPKFEVKPTRDELGELAAKTGHGGGDFWVLYYFARHILTGEPGPFDIYGAADVTIPGILAYRSALEGGKAYDVPNFRNKAERDAWRGDTLNQERFDAQKGAFPEDADRALTGRFTTIIKDLIALSITYRAYVDWNKVRDDMVDPGALAKVVSNVLLHADAMPGLYAEARALADAYPGSPAARVLNEMLEVGGEADVMKPGFKAAIRRSAAMITRRYGVEALNYLTKGEVSPRLPALRDIRDAKATGRGVKWAAMPFLADGKLLDARTAFGGKDGMVYIRGTFVQKKAGTGALLMGADGPFKVWLNGKAVGSVRNKSNPATPDEFRYPVSWRKGRNTVLVALNSNKGHAWGVQVRADC